MPPSPRRRGATDARPPADLRNPHLGVTMLRPTDDAECPCTLLPEGHRASAHEAVDYREALRLYLTCARIPVDVHAEAVERMYSLRRPKVARAVQRMFEDLDKRRRVAVRRRRSG